MGRWPSCSFFFRVTGPLMSTAQRQALDLLAAGHDDLEITASTTDLPTLLERADLVVAMAGYNTSVEIVASGKPAILVPRAAPRAEQRMRAAMFNKLGLVWSLKPGAELDARLARRIERILTRARRLPRRRELDLDGAVRVGDLFESIVTNRNPAIREAGSWPQ